MWYCEELVSRVNLEVGQAALQLAEGALPLPEFTPCASTTQPTLPAQWQATALMQDFFLNTLTFGNFVYDESVNAFRFAIADQYGLDVDLLTTTDGKLYELQGDGDMPTSCTLLTNSSPYTVPDRAWLGDGWLVWGGESFDGSTWTELKPATLPPTIKTSIIKSPISIFYTHAHCQKQPAAEAAAQPAVCSVATA